MKQYCTYFDQNFLPQGVALWRSLVWLDGAAVLWVLALDDITAEVLHGIGAPGLRVVTLRDVEAGDLALAAAKLDRTRVEYYFTLSPCWPLWLLNTKKEIEQLAYIDADMLFFESPGMVFDAMRGGSILICKHNFPWFLQHYEKHGRYNVGVQVWRRDANALACLAWWREKCLEWCYDKLEEGRYADQKYLDSWPQRFEGVVVCNHPGINLAPWNWMQHRYEFAADGRLTVDGEPLVIYHYARFRALLGSRIWQSGQLDYGVMPERLRCAIYGPYWSALQAAEADIQRVKPDWCAVGRKLRLNRAFWRELPLRILFGSDWARNGARFYSGRFGLGRYSGHFLARLRRIFLRK